jgi:Sulfite exporter TauE/SafE
VLPRAIGTSVFVLIGASASGFLVYLHQGHVNWPLVGWLCAGSTAGAFLAPLALARFGKARLERVFRPSSTHIRGTHVPMEEPSTASIADIPRLWAISIFGPRGVEPAKNDMRLPIAINCPFSAGLSRVRSKFSKARAPSTQRQKRRAWFCALARASSLCRLIASL